MTALQNRVEIGNELALRYLKSPEFDRLYKSVMAMVEDAASYLDKDGRAAQKTLKGLDTVAYIRLTQKITTEAMRVASIMLALRSVRDGGMRFEQAIHDIKKGDGCKKDGEGIDLAMVNLPERIIEIDQTCMSLREEAIRFLNSLTSDAAETRPNAVHAAMGALTNAFTPGDS
jgi:regulator of CtrA degradation